MKRDITIMDKFKIEPRLFKCDTDTCAHAPGEITQPDLSQTFNLWVFLKVLTQESTLKRDMFRQDKLKTCIRIVIVL